MCWDPCHPLFSANQYQQGRWLALIRRITRPFICETTCKVLGQLRKNSLVCYPMHVPGSLYLQCYSFPNHTSHVTCNSNFFSLEWITKYSLTTSFQAAKVIEKKSVDNETEEEFETPLEEESCALFVAVSSKHGSNKHPFEKIF